MIILEITVPIKQQPRQQQVTQTNAKTKRKKEKTVSFETLLNMAMGKN